MRDKEIGIWHKIFVLLLFAGVVVSISLAYSEEKFKLKTGARGKICLDCHVLFQDKLKSPFVHTPVKTGECSGCHNPHSSSHGKLLASDANKICFRCHKAMVPEGAQSFHTNVVEGNCTKCHDPHGAENKNNLLRLGNKLCFGCHEDMGKKIAGNKFKHAPVESGCLNCHNPHASAKSDFLLKNSVPSLCLNCHKTDRQIFKNQHMNYPVADASCTACHNPHGSGSKGLLFGNVHSPFAKKMCNQCHEGPSSAAPLKIKKSGFELCMGCHSSMINEVFTKNRVHWPLVDKTGCLNCHNPHASPEEGLLKNTLIKVCGACHSDTIDRQKIVETKHPPVKEGMCTACHSPHSSDGLFLLNQPSVIDICGSCHEWQKHSTHPIGEKFIDLRNKNLTLECLSCHRSHGTEFEKMLYFKTSTELCIQCHTDKI